VSERRKIFGEKFIDLGNYTIVALIFGQLTIAQKDSAIILSGILLAVLFWIIGFLILKEKRRRKK